MLRTYSSSRVTSTFFTCSWIDFAWCWRDCLFFEPSCISEEFFTKFSACTAIASVCLESSCKDARCINTAIDFHIFTQKVFFLNVYDWKKSTHVLHVYSECVNTKKQSLKKVNFMLHIRKVDLSKLDWIKFIKGCCMCKSF